MSGRGQSQANNDNKSGQCNPNNPEDKTGWLFYLGSHSAAIKRNQ